VSCAALSVPLAAASELRLDCGHLCGEVGIFADAALDLANRVQHCGMVGAADAMADLGQRRCRQLAAEKAGDVAGAHDSAGAAARRDVEHRDAIERSDRLHDAADGERPPAGWRERRRR
jgi:hypothetical protein